jgi:hypothetical protein
MSGMFNFILISLFIFGTYVLGALSITVALHVSLCSCNSCGWGRRFALAFCPSLTCELSVAAANIVRTHHQSASYSTMLNVGWGEDSVSYIHQTPMKRWKTCRRHVQRLRSFVGNAFYTVFQKDFVIWNEFKYVGKDTLHDLAWGFADWHL